MRSEVGVSKETEPVAPRPEPQFDISFCALGSVLIIVATVLTFWWVASDPTQPRFLGAGDCWTYYGPTLHYMDNRIHNGELPLWNPLYLCGQPHAANPQSWVFYPPNLIRSLLTFNPTPIRTHVGIAIMILFHLLLGGLSTFFLARSHGLSYGASLAAAFAFTFSAALVTRAVGHWIFLNTACWLPSLLLLMKLAMTRSEWRQKILFALGAGVAWGMSILGGVPNLILLVGLTAGTYAILLRVLYPRAGFDAIFNRPPISEVQLPPTKKDRRQKKPPPPRKWRRRARLVAGLLTRDVAVWSLVVVIGMLVAAALLWPAAEFAKFAPRGDTGANAKEDLAHVAGIWNILKILVIYQGHGHVEAPRASGAAVFFLALVAVVCRPRRDTALFAALFLMLLDCSISEPVLFGRLVDWLAPFKLSNPGRGMVIACLPLGLLAGLGTDAALASITSLRWRLARSAAIAALGIAVLLVLILAARPEPVLPVGVLAILLPAAVIVVALIAGWLPEPIVWGSLIAMLILGETLAWNKYLIPSVMPESIQYTGSMDSLATPRTFWSTNRRTTAIQPNVPLYDFTPAINGYDPLEIQAVQEVLCTTHGSAAFRRMVNAAEATGNGFRGNSILKRPFWLARQYVQGPLPDRGVPFPAVTTVFLDTQDAVPIPSIERPALPARTVSENVKKFGIRPPNAPPQAVRSQDVTEAGTSLRFKPIALPPLHSSLYVSVSGTTDVAVQPYFGEPKSNRIEFGPRFIVKAGSPAQLYEIPLPDFDEIEIFFMPDFRNKSGEFSIGEMYVLSDQDDEDALISVVARSANRAEVEVRNLPGPRMLVCVDAYYPGWEAYVDGKPALIFRADSAFKAVAVPPGGHRVLFVFRPWRVYVGILVSIVTLVTVAVSLALLRPRPRRQEAVSSS